jgi:integrase
MDTVHEQVTLTVNQSLERIKGEFRFKPPKTSTSRRTISLPARTTDALRAHHKAQLEERLKLGLGRDPQGVVFARPDGQPLDLDSLTKSFGRLIAEIRVTSITLKGLRHTHISRPTRRAAGAPLVRHRFQGGRRWSPPR